MCLHWFPLVMADRINAVEGIIDDIRCGHFPNILAQRGIAAEWKYNRTNLLKKAAIAAGIAAVAILCVAETEEGLDEITKFKSQL